jgi:hypothetical protein
MSSHESYQRQRTLADWLERRRVLTLRVPDPNPEQEQALEVTVSSEQAKQLRNLTIQPGWQLYSMRLAEVTEQSHQWLLDAETPEEWRYRNGYLQGHLKTRQLLEVLISQSEIGDEEWAQAQLREMTKQAARTLLLTAQTRAGNPVSNLEEASSRLARFKERMGLTETS